jgi:uncharacterized membrane protein YkvA (DUF1232 family)
MLPVEWVWGATLFTFGVLYIELPFDLIPDHLMVGWVDDVVIGGGGMFIGAILMYEAHLENPIPMTAKLIPPMIVVLLMVIVAYMFEDIRKTLIGILALVSAPFAIFAVVEGYLALGLALIVCAFMYLLLEIDIIPDELHPVIGLLDDSLLGVVPMVLGLVIVGWTIFQGNLSQEGQLVGL